MGGRLFHFSWCDDFSAARNESLRHARGDWIFWMDSDDTIPPECGRGLRDLVAREVEPSLLGYVIQVHCPAGGEEGDGSSGMTVVDHVKLFRNRPDLRFDGRIHEQILGAIR
jgi:glycosyltransferase involved in cell wall biosynthesis